ncbi:MAG: DNA replication and repair protein RecF [Chitinophagaceae bacterium]
MFVKKITLSQFRNYARRSFEFTEKIVCICGPNGSGKTNLIDAIHYLCFTKSYFSKPENTNSFSGLQGFRLEGDFENTEGNQHLVCIYRETGRKEIIVNDELCKKFSDHIGKFPAIFIAPDDVLILSGVPENRRLFIDSIISQTDHLYLKKLIEYRQVLDQRNSFLKNAASNNFTDKYLLETFNLQLIALNNFIFEKRKLFFTKFLPLAEKVYNNIAGNTDQVTLSYFSQLQEENIEDLLKQNIDRDLYLQRTGNGIHKDDLDIKINGLLFKNAASQGQRKSLLFALKLAAFDIIKENKNRPPVLLLDDVFEKLDETRMQNLLQKVCLENDGQVFITDTHADRLQTAFSEMNMPFQMIML